MLCSFEDVGSRLRFHFEHFDRPIYEFSLNRKLTPGHIGFYAVTGGIAARQNTATFRDFSVTKVNDVESYTQPSARDIVLDALDLTNPALNHVAQAIESDNRKQSGHLTTSDHLGATLLLRHIHPTKRYVF